MDKELHFVISAVFAFGFLFLFFSRASDTKVAAWQLSAAQAIRRRQIVGGAILGIALVVILGIWKEWGDSFGLGNLEAADIAADLLGVAVGFVVASLWQRTNRSKVSYRVKFRSPNQPHNPTAPKPAGPQLRSRIRRGNSESQPDSPTNTSD
ncbi:MAG: hypothetical protein ABIH23_36500 [bacterium]